MLILVKHGLEKLRKKGKVKIIFWNLNSGGTIYIVGPDSSKTEFPMSTLYKPFKKIFQKHKPCLSWTFVIVKKSKKVDYDNFFSSGSENYKSLVFKFGTKI